MPDSFPAYAQNLRNFTYAVCEARDRHLLDEQLYQTARQALDASERAAAQSLVWLRRANILIDMMTARATIGATAAIWIGGFFLPHGASLASVVLALALCSVAFAALYCGRRRRQLAKQASVLFQSAVEAVAESMLENGYTLAVHIGDQAVPVIRETSEIDND